MLRGSSAPAAGPTRDAASTRATKRLGLFITLLVPAAGSAPRGVPGWLLSGAPPPSGTSLRRRRLGSSLPRGIGQGRGLDDLDQDVVGGQDEEALESQRFDRGDRGDNPGAGLR